MPQGQYSLTDATPVGAYTLAEAEPFRATNEKDAQGNAVVDPNTLGTLGSHLWSQVNPIAAVQTISHALMHPVDTTKQVGAAQGALFDKAKAAYDKGDYLTAARHFVDYLIPLVGPAIDKSSDLFQAGHWAAGSGDALGIGLSLFGPTAVSRHLRELATSQPAQALADTADAKANQNVVDVVAPKVGANKVRFGKMAADVAPAIARDTTGVTRGGIADSVAAHLEDATAGLDAAAEARNPNLVYHTRPILDALQAARDRLTAQTVRDGRLAAGTDTVPAPNAARVAQIDSAMQSVKNLGPIAHFEALRRIREAFDGPAKAVYSQAVTPDYLTNQGSKLGAADVTAALREHLATFDPATAAANVQYSLWKKASDVITAAEETERVRPTVGRTLMARGLGAVAGGGMGGGFGAAVGALVAPVVERVAASASPALKMVLARQLATVADAIRSGDLGRAKAALASVQKMAPVATGLTAAERVSPSALPLDVPKAAAATPAATPPER